MAGKSDDPSGIISGINVTPLVDVTLVLLIIMMVTAKIIASPAVPVDLPKAAKTEDTQVVFSVILPLNGATLINGKATADDAAFIKLARETLSANKELRAVINADAKVSYERALKTLDLLKQAGLSRISFGATPTAPMP